MKGVVFNVVEDVVREVLSEDAWDDVIVEAGVDGAYTSLGTYADEELAAIVAVTARAADMTASDTLRLVGRRGFKHLASRAPHVLDGLDDWRAVLISLDGIIHPEVLKIYADATTPGFEAVTDGDDLRVTYTSSRRMCALADGLILGSGDWFGTELVVEHESCVEDGDDSCTMRVSETSVEAAPAP